MRGRDISSPCVSLYEIVGVILGSASRGDGGARPIGRARRFFSAKINHLSAYMLAKR